MKEPYALYPDGRFVIHDYNQKKPFSNFLPGIAGLYGTPLWVFYVNRGQGVASFGTKNKDNAILEFFPANKAYQNVTSLGFRTFIKIKNPNGKTVFYEPFQENLEHGPEQSLTISSHEFAIEEMNKNRGLKTEVRYFTVPGEPLPTLARELALTNTSGYPMEMELLDGLPQINPYGMNEYFVKNMSRTIEAWMVVENRDKNAPFFRLCVDPTDRPETVFIEGGNFFFSLTGGAGKAEPLETFVDPAMVFGSMLDFREPKGFYLCESSFGALAGKQILQNRTPCAFSHAKLRLSPGQTKKIASYFGHAENLETLNRFMPRARKAGYLEEKREENRRVIEGVKSPIFTVTSLPAYDLYCGQTYLDNVMRGGLPVCLGNDDENLVFYVYSRKHGDLERDYNRFMVEPAYFAQGDGNYRDVNQNRRNDVWFEPRVRDLNIKTFLNLIQLDGYNPLVIKGTSFQISRNDGSKRVLKNFLSKEGMVACEGFLWGRKKTAQGFTLGEFYRFLERDGFISRPRFMPFLKELRPYLVREEKSEHGEGFWVDHWAYNLDLIESYLGIYPEDAPALFFERVEFSFHDSDHRVQPRSQKYFLKKEKAVRQYRSVVKDAEKAALLSGRRSDASLVRTRSGRGEVYRTTLFVKLLCLFANKLASLDAEGVGIEMEADKPSWLDALNGLPGLLGSSLSETFELKRLALFLIQALEDAEIDLSESLLLPEELHEFVRVLNRSLENHFREKSADKNFRFWNEASDAKERFRESTRLGLSGKEKKLTFAEAKAFLEHGREKVEIGLGKSFHDKTGLFPTYFENQVASYRLLNKGVSAGASADEALPNVKPLHFKQAALPYFLEGPVHALKIEKDPTRRKSLLKSVRESGLYDKKIDMYKLSAPLSPLSLEVGRSRVFTPGWLENESVWLHMEYKFLLEILKGGMAEEFFRDFRKMLVPFQPAARYGRSILENSSFIVSSAFLDPSFHGTGFVARLSGSTAEFLSMWLVMNVGKKPFTLGNDGKLLLRFQPTLPAYLFLKEETSRAIVDREGNETRIRVPKDSVAFMLFGKTLVFYHNPKRLDTFGRQRASVKKLILKDRRGKTVELKGDTVPSPYAERVRKGEMARIDIELG